MVNLEDLRWEHSMRNVPMVTLGAEMRTKGSRDWVNMAKFTVGGMSYNELSPCWRDSHDFQARFREISVDRPSALG